MNNNPWESESWNVSQCNYWEEVRNKFELSTNLQFHDATLRDGEQSPGVVFSVEDKISIAQQLDKIGMHRIEAGMPAVSQQDFDAISQISKMGLKSKIFGFSRAMPGDIEKVVASGVSGTVIEITCGESRLKYAHPKWELEDVVKQSVDTIRFAKQHGLYTVYFPYDTTRSAPAFLKELLIQVCEKANPDAVAVVDTTGTIIPSAMRVLIHRVRGYVKGRPVEVHTHNDLGMGVANALAAVEAGAEVVHGCVNGLGERCGNASIEEMIVAAEALYGIKTGINCSLLKETCLLIEKLSGVKVPFNKPIAGPAAYMKESGVGIKVAYEHPLVTFPIGEKFVGGTRVLVLGKKSGKDSINMKLNEINIKLPEEKVETLLDQVKQLSIKERRYLTDQEFKDLLDKIL
jgi:methanogen homocitrate synthase